MSVQRADLSVAHVLTASIDSEMKLGRLKKNFDLSNTPNVVRSFSALDAFSNTGKNT
jgi:hypothetical protein